MMDRQLRGRVDCLGIDGDEASVLVYDLGSRVALVATTRENGDAEVVLERTQALEIAALLKQETRP